MKNKTTAALLAFFLGGIGIQYFYLGKPFKGVLCLLFCWTFIPCFIALFHFIYYLAISQDSFDAKYNPQYIRVTQPVQVVPLTPAAPAVPRLVAAPFPSAVPATSSSTARATMTPAFPAMAKANASSEETTSTANELHQLFELKQQGILTEDEYILHKARLLA